MSPIISPSGGGGGGSQPVEVFSVTLSTTAILGLSTPVAFPGAPAPGAGKAYMILRIETQALPGTTPFGVPANARLQVGAVAQLASDYSLWETRKASEDGGNDTTSKVLNGPFGEDLFIWPLNSPPAQPGGFPSSVVDNEPLAVANPGHDFNGGTILTATITDAGSGYAPGDQFTIFSAGNPAHNTAIGEVDTVGGGGAVLTFHLVSGGDPGSAYFTDYGNPRPTQKSGGGGDNGLTLTVTGTDRGDGELVVSVAYTVIDLF